jgi:class 3 adenylate cyclase
VSLESLSNIVSIARFLGAPQQTVSQLLHEDRLGGALLATLRSRGIAVTPGVRDSIETVVRTLKPPPGYMEQGSGYGVREDSFTPYPVPRTLYPARTVTIMFTDLVNSTAMLERLGDQLGRETLRKHNEIIRRHTKACGGAEVKFMGDGFMLTFQSARQGVACAVAVQREMARHNRERPEVGAYPLLISPLARGRLRGGTPLLSVRMGLSVGQPVREDADLLGKPVVLAARISAKAQGGQVLVSESVRALVSDTESFTFRALGVFELKGIAGSHPLYEVVWNDHESRYLA